MEKQLKNWLKKLKLSEPTISTFLGAFVIIIVGILIFNYFKSDSTETDLEKIAGGGELTFTVPEAEEETTNIPEALPETYTVENTDSLWKISEKLYGSGYNWVDIASENEITNPDFIKAGIELKLPKVAVKKPIQEEQVAGATITTVEDVEVIEGNTYAVQKGDSLWKIAVRAYGDGYKWPEIAKASNLLNPDYLEEGRELTLPR